MPIKFRVPWLAVILLLIAVLTACNGDSEEPTRLPTRTTVTEPAATAKPTATEPETKAEKTLVPATTVAPPTPTKVTATPLARPTPTPTPTPTGVSEVFEPLMEHIPDYSRLVFLMDISAVRDMRSQYPGDFDTFLEDLEDDVAMEVYVDNFNIRDVSVLAVAAEYISEDDLVLLKGNWDLEEMQEYLEPYKENSHLRYDIYSISGEHVILEESELLAVAHNEEIAMDVIEIASGLGEGLTSAEENVVKRLLDRLGPAPVVIALDSGDCGEVVPGCLGFGASLVSADAKRLEVYINTAVMFNSERAASTTTTLCKKGALNPYSWRPAHTLDSFIVVPSSKRIQVKIPRI